MTLTLRDIGTVAGLSGMERETGSPTVLASGSFVPVLEIENVQNILDLTGVKFTFTGGPSPVGPVYRFKGKLSSEDNYHHIAPYDTAGQTLVDGKTDTFTRPILIPKGGSFKIEVGTTSASGGTSVTVVLDFIRYRP